MSVDSQRRKITPLNAWAFSFACAIGWAAFVQPATRFLPVGGVTGSTLAFLAAAVAMSLIALNYHYLSNLYPAHGGIYNLVHMSMNREYAFAASWGMGLAHLCCIPLNARAMGMLTRTILEESFGLDFEVYFFGSDTLLIEAVIVVVVLILFGLLNIRGLRRTALVQTAGAIILLGGIVIMLIGALIAAKDVPAALTPAYYPGTNHNKAFMAIFILTPWAFVGFDSVSKLSPEAGFPLKKLGRIMIISVLCCTFAYVANIFIALLGKPDSFAAWPEYMDQLKGQPGVNGYPVAIAAKNAMGRVGTVIFFASCLSATITGLVGFFASISRLIHQMANDGFLVPSLAKTDPKFGTPANAIRLVVVMALLLSLLRNAFDFIEELASVATAVGYGICSLAAFLDAVKHRSKAFIFTGAMGVLLCLFWIFFLLVPVEGLSASISMEAMIYVVAWVFLGITVFVFSARKKDSLFPEDHE